MRDTSIKTFKEIIAEGLLPKMQQEVYEVIYEHGPLTATQLRETYGRDKSRGVWDSGEKRLSELKKKGVVIEVGKTKCPVTGRSVYLWDVTSMRPSGSKPRDEKKTKKQKKTKIVVCSNCHGWWDADEKFTCPCGLWAKLIDGFRLEDDEKENT
jgi:hypothetical protein